MFYKQLYLIQVMKKNMNNLKNFIMSEKTKIAFKCRRCGKKSSFEINGVLKCSYCNEVYTYNCLFCGHVFRVGERVEYCVVCGWFKCPRCGKCGCIIKFILDFYKKNRKKIIRELQQKRLARYKGTAVEKLLTLFRLIE